MNMKIELLSVVYLRDFFESEESYNEFWWWAIRENLHLPRDACDHFLIPVSKLVDLLFVWRENGFRPSHEVAEGIKSILELNELLERPLYVSL